MSKDSPCPVAGGWAVGARSAASLWLPVAVAWGPPNWQRWSGHFCFCLGAEVMGQRRLAESLLLYLELCESKFSTVPS